jgi:hypothetical protein
MRRTLALARALIVPIAVAASSAAFAQERPPSADERAAGARLPSSSPEVLTGKERLGEKWKDEQRLDNCKVPHDKRGPKPRPDTCPKVPTG